MTLHVHRCVCHPLSEALAKAPLACGIHMHVAHPVLRARNWVYGAEGEVLEYGEYVAVADRWSTYEYLIDAGRAEDSAPGRALIIPRRA
jgi:hypothetical protein